MTNYKLVPASDVKKLSDETILDVRTVEEHEAQRLVREHDHVVLDQLNPEDFMLRRGLDKEAPVYILCRSGQRARTAADKFAASGYKNILVIEGGIIACEKDGQAVEGASGGGACALPKKPGGGGCA